MPPQAFHLVLSDYIAVKEKLNPKQKGNLLDDLYEYLLRLLYVVISIYVCVHYI